MSESVDIKTAIREIRDFPKPGILFRDITTVLRDPASLRASIDAIVGELRGMDFDVVAGPESRGFIFSMPVAYALHKGFVPARKKGKLPAKTVSRGYQLEYGEEYIEMHADAFEPGSRVVVVDDLLATGGTCKALFGLIESMGGVVAGAVFLIELTELGGRDKLAGYDTRSIVRY
ncbi:MAG: adenine phosphoribosyltransferase [Clostridiales bacterium]|jgi:adenine phosphoribosyltransferase|nr:adenine phosphoribosyltransferase [Clostridiales bacterium]